MSDYKQRTNYTTEQLDQAALDDIKCDIKQAEELIARGRDDWKPYAEKLRASIAKYEKGGAHAAVMKGLI